MSISQPPALVFGGDVTALAVLRALGRARVETLGARPGGAARAPLALPPPGAGRDRRRPERRAARRLPRRATVGAHRALPLHGQLGDRAGVAARAGRRAPSGGRAAALGAARLGRQGAVRRRDRGPRRPAPRTFGLRSGRFAGPRRAALRLVPQADQLTALRQALRGQGPAAVQPRPGQRAARQMAEAGHESSSRSSSPARLRPTCSSTATSTGRAGCGAACPAGDCGCSRRRSATARCRRRRPGRKSRQRSSRCAGCSRRLGSAASSTPSSSATSATARSRSSRSTGARGGSSRSRARRASTSWGPPTATPRACRCPPPPVPRRLPLRPPGPRRARLAGHPREPRAAPALPAARVVAAEANAVFASDDPLPALEEFAAVPCGLLKLGLRRVLVTAAAAARARRLRAGRQPLVRRLSR